MKSILQRPSIARRTFIALLVACALVWLAIYLLGRYLVNQSESGNFDREMLSFADTVRIIAERHPDPYALSIALSGLEASIDSEARVLRIPKEFRNFHIRSADGALVAKSASALDAHLGRTEQLEFFDAKHEDKAYRVYALWTADRKYRIELTQSMKSRNDAFNSVMMSREGLLLPLLVGFPVLLIPIWLAIRFGLRPVRRLSSELASRQPGDLRPLNAPNVDAELLPLVKELNETFTRLNSLLQRERAFLADAAHEMRTPLAVIAAQADTLSLATEEQSHAEAIQRLQAGINRCSRLVNQLLDLARLEADTHEVFDRIDIADVIRDCLAAHAHEARQRDVSITYDGPDHCETMLPRHALESVLDNLVGNAARYVNRGGVVIVTLAQYSDHHIRLCVSDNGAGIPPADRAAMFERFRRGTDVATVGSGLGLAIAATGARQCGAQIEVSDGLDGRGVSFSMTWRRHLATQNPTG